MKKLLITFDYELYLGTKSGTAQKCMIEPTNKILNILDQQKYKAIFFVDTTYLIELNKIVGKYPRALADLNAIMGQLRDIVKKGHYIFPHLHPHWLDAVYNADSNEWNLSNCRYYCFSSLNVDQQNLLFEKSVEIIRSVANSVKSDYVIDGYRAGGWSIQPFPVFKSQFLKHGITHEFSVRKENYLKSNAQCYDFRYAPKKDIYRFNDDIVKEDASGEFLEYTISTITLNNYQKWLASKLDSLAYRLKMTGYGDGYGTIAKVIESEDRNEQQGGFELMASIEGINIFNYLEFKKEFEKRDYFHFISHPKMVTPLQLNLFGRLLKNVGKRETDFRNFPEIAMSVPAPVTMEQLIEVK